MKPAVVLALAIMVCSPPLAGGEAAKTDAVPASSVSYRSISLTDPAWLKMKKGLPSADLLLAKINRMDLPHLRRKRRVIAPTKPVSVTDCSPFPTFLEQAASWPKLVLVSLEIQAFGAYESGRLVRWGPVSTGIKKLPTPANLYYSNWKSRRKVSSLDHTWVMPWYVNLHTSMGVAFHQYAMPGKPDSHGCIRLLKEDATWMFRWTDHWVASENRVAAKVFGTPVVVFGEYRYSEPPPWMSLPQNPSATDVTVWKITEALSRYALVIEQRARQRESFYQPELKLGLIPGYGEGIP